jgi:hypothetical protein
MSEGFALCGLASDCENEVDFGKVICDCRFSGGRGHARNLLPSLIACKHFLNYFLPLFFAEIDLSSRVHSGEHALSSGLAMNSTEQTGQTLATKRRGVNLPDLCSANDWRVVRLSSPASMICL